MTDPEKQGKRLLAVVKPMKKIGEMTDDERDELARQIVGVATTVNDPPDPPSGKSGSAVG